MATRAKPRDLTDIVIELQRRVAILETSTRIGYASIDDGGQLVVLNAAGAPVLRIGTLSIGGYGIERWNGTAWVLVT
jgi:hypothetical protein